MVIIYKTLGVCDATCVCGIIVEEKKSGKTFSISEASENIADA